MLFALKIFGKETKIQFQPQTLLLLLLTMCTNKYDIYIKNIWVIPFILIIFGKVEIYSRVCLDIK